MTIKIDKGIPLGKRLPNAAPKYPFADMGIGDSFAIPCDDGDSTKAIRQQIKAAARNYISKHDPSASFRILRQQTEVRCWRLT